MRAWTVKNVLSAERRWRRKGGGYAQAYSSLAEKSDEETAEELRDIADVLSITADTDTNIKKSMEAIMRIAYRIDRRKEK